MELIVAYMSLLILGKLAHEDYSDKKKPSYLDELDSE